MAPVRAPAVPGSRQKTSEQGEDTPVARPPGWAGQEAAPLRPRPLPPRSRAHSCPCHGRHRRPECGQERRATLALRSSSAGGRAAAPGAGERGGPGSMGGWPAEAVPSRQPSLPPQQDWGAERGGSVSRGVETTVSPEPGGLGCPGRAMVLRWAHSAWRRPASTSFWNQERRNTDEQVRAPGSATPAVERSRSRGRAASRGAPPLVSAAPVPAPRLGPASAPPRPFGHRILIGAPVPAATNRGDCCTTR